MAIVHRGQNDDPFAEMTDCAVCGRAIGVQENHRCPVLRETHDFWCRGPLRASSWRYVQCPTCKATVDMFGGNEL